MASLTILPYIHVQYTCAQLHPTLPHHGLQLPGSSVRGILQARILEWVAVPYSRGSSRPRDCLSFIGRQILYHCATWDTHHIFTQNINLLYKRSKRSRMIKKKKHLKVFIILYKVVKVSTLWIFIVVIHLKKNAKHQHEHQDNLVLLEIRNEIEQEIMREYLNIHKETNNK